MCTRVGEFDSSGGRGGAGSSGTVGVGLRKTNLVVPSYINSVSLTAKDGIVIEFPPGSYEIRRLDDVRKGVA